MARRRPTSTDVARLAGVSRTTVSFVLNERDDARISAETRRRVLEAAESLGYHVHAPARQLAAGSTRTLGLVLRQSPEHVAIDPLVPETLRGLAAAARGDGYRVLVEPLPPGEGSSYDSLLRSQHADGLVVSGPRSDDEELLRLAGEGYPLVLQGTFDGRPVASVDIDNRAAARVAVDHLVALGHREIACVTNAPLEYTAASERVAGYREALEAAGIGYDPDLVVRGAFDAESGRVAARSLLASGRRPTAIFVASDVVAFGVIGALRTAKLRVPADVSVVGFDDIPLAPYADPPLTTIHTPAFDLGEVAGRILLDLIEGREIRRRTMLPAPLVVRSSTAAPSPDRVHAARNAANGP